METISTGTAIYGLPHIGAEYTAGWKAGRKNYRRTADSCFLCDSARACNVHHAIGFGLGGGQDSRTIELDRPFCASYDIFDQELSADGPFELFTPLFAVCGSGTTGCHCLLEPEGGAYQVEWVWDDAEAKELWEKGWFLSHGYSEHDTKLYEFGLWRIRDRNGNVVREVRSCA